MRLVVPVTTEAPNLAVQKTARELAGASISENTRRAPTPEPCAASIDGSPAAACTMRPWPGVRWEQADAAAAVAANDGRSVKGLPGRRDRRRHE